MKLITALKLIDFGYTLKVRVLYYPDEDELFVGYAKDVPYWVADYKLAEINRFEGEPIEYVGQLDGNSEYSKDAGFIIYVDENE